jgi:hypothetical protein
VKCAGTPAWRAAHEYGFGRTCKNLGDGYDTRAHIDDRSRCSGCTRSCRNRECRNDFVEDRSGTDQRHVSPGQKRRARIHGAVVEATITNDAGQIPLPSGGNYATVDLIARTASGDKVVSHRTVTNTLPVSFPPQFLNQTTRYYARVNAAPANGIAASKRSSMILLRAFLRNTHVVYRSKGAVGFAGIYPQVPGVSLPRSVRVLVQRRVGTKWVTLAKTGPNRGRSWAARVLIGKVPAVFRVRTVPIAPARYLPATELRYCVASTAARARRLCRSVALGLNTIGSPAQVIAVAADD